jgi:hypothetical protein
MSEVENKNGYLLLSAATSDDDCSPVLVKANKISAIREIHGATRIYAYDNTYDVTEDIDDILTQLDNIHPSLR